MSKLKDIKKPIEKELQIFEGIFKDSMKSTVPLLDRITYYIVRRKGKQVRPMFVFLCARVFGPIEENTYTAASLIELLHTASLVHDDVVDDSHQRRGAFSINALWKNKIAVLVGDYLLSKGLLLAVEKEQFETLKIVSTAVKQLSEGELLQFEKTRKLDITEDIYLDIIRQKTASLMAAACSAGVSSAQGGSEAVEDFRLFGELAGMAFQIKDDLFDYGYQNIGKPTGLDIKEKKLTLPLIHALGKAPYSEKRNIIKKIKKKSGDKKVRNEIISFVRNSGGLEYAKEKMLSYKQQALDVLKKYPVGPATESLEDLIEFVVDRKS